MFFQGFLNLVKKVHSSFRFFLKDPQLRMCFPELPSLFVVTLLAEIAWHILKTVAQWIMPHRLAIYLLVWQLGGYMEWHMASRHPINNNWVSLCNSVQVWQIICNRLNWNVHGAWGVGGTPCEYLALNGQNNVIPPLANSHFTFLRCACTDHVHSWLPPHWLSNQRHCITCTLPSSQSANCMMCSTNHHLTCKTVFLHNSPLAPNINYWSYGDKTCVKLRQCVQLTCLDIKGTKLLQSFAMFPTPHWDYFV